MFEINFIKDVLALELCYNGGKNQRSKTYWNGGTEMKKSIVKLFFGVMIISLLTACLKNKPVPSPIEEDNTDLLTNAIMASYYLDQDSPAYDYFHHTSIQRFLAMWVKNETGDIDQPIWQDNIFTKIVYVDADLKVMYPDQQLYCCNFSYQNNRYGYVVFAYNASDPSITNWEVKETTPYSYDLNKNINEIRDHLIKTDIDPDSVQARCIYLYDKVQKRADQAIEFTDGKGDHYICCYGDPEFKVEKWQIDK
ncbi:hypothetical protein [Beduini sp.]|uniref:hypothetical protein n=1 Tax=Beduini sp. TaxID=1922300 RepID=UPI0039A02026